jgi:hypothetical protein
LKVSAQDAIKEMVSGLKHQKDSDGSEGASKKKGKVIAVFFNMEFSDSCACNKE